MSEAGMRVIVAGPPGPVGGAVLERLAGDGARVVACTTAEGDVPGGARPIPVGGGDDGAPAAALDQALAVLGGLDALVCLTGDLHLGSLLETGPGDWQATLERTLVAPYLWSLACLPVLREGGGGAIVHVSSDAGLWAEAAVGASSVAHAALLTLAQMLAIEAAPHGIRVNAVCPGELGADGAAPALVAPLGRPVRPEEVAAAVAFLLRPEAAFVNGATLPVDGGVRAAYRATRPA